ncbi:hypothetical protein PHMEG_0004774 [Phytophthora megakarya]|uniref:Uncharacterized protein n=1 Tax=Phytophthora megakarya TaxID=4795 RepID=A0A225WUL7_9STRA|nr:hypothetical protein PHMEG_0004774 [Phytophthora megakarya]
MENVMQSCMSAIASHRCVGDDLQHASPLNPQDHLRVLASLVNKDITGAVCVPPTRAYVEISSRSTWSPLHSLACCDKLRSAAAMVLPQDDNEANVDSREFFSCAPSLVARRVDVASSSLDLLHQVIKKLHTLEDTDHDSDGAFSDGFAIRRAETDEELVDLNRSS